MKTSLSKENLHDFNILKLILASKNKELTVLIVNYFEAGDINKDAYLNVIASHIDIPFMIDFITNLPYIEHFSMCLDIHCQWVVSYSDKRISTIEEGDSFSNYSRPQLVDALLLVCKLQL